MPVMLASTTSKGKIMRTIQTITKILVLPVLLAGCDQHALDMSFFGNGDCGAPREPEIWNASELKSSGVGGCKECPGWNYRVGSEVYPEGEADFGCASAHNLGKMVANKQELLEGHAMSPGYAARHDRFTEYYLTDQTKGLLKGEKVIAQ